MPLKERNSSETCIVHQLSATKLINYLKIIKNAKNLNNQPKPAFVHNMHSYLLKDSNLFISAKDQ